ncbi:DUF4440 domain-containing protein [Streptosporangium sp. NPDC003464]
MTAPRRTAGGTAGDDPGEAAAAGAHGAAAGDPRGAADAAACRAEIVRLHRIIEGWLSGRTPRTAGEFAAFAQAHLPDFTLSGPDGASLTRGQVLAWVEAAHGRVPGIEIRIREVELVAAAGPLLVAAYQEWQHGTGADRNRRATVVFLRDPDAPHGLRWRHLHETWTPEP